MTDRTQLGRTHEALAIREARIAAYRTCYEAFPATVRMAINMALTKDITPLKREVQARYTVERGIRVGGDIQHTVNAIVEWDEKGNGIPILVSWTSGKVMLEDIVRVMNYAVRDRNL